jgi:hypothetical protein
MENQPSKLSAIDDIDHLMMSVFDHDSAILSFTKLGFRVRPVRQLSPMGGGDAGGNGGSAAILLRARTPGCANYLEIARADPEKSMQIMKDLLCNREGPAMLVHATLDPDELYARWESLAITMHRIELVLQPFGEGPPVDLQVFLVEPNQAAFNFNACWYSDPYDFERDEWRDHPNTALHWGGLSLPIDDALFDHEVKRFSLIYGVPASFDNGCAIFQPGATYLKLHPKSSFHKLYGNTADGGIVHIIVNSIKAVIEQLEENEIPHDIVEAGVRVSALYGSGSHLLFEEI